MNLRRIKIFLIFIFVMNSFTHLYAMTLYQISKDGEEINNFSFEKDCLHKLKFIYENNQVKSFVGKLEKAYYFSNGYIEEKNVLNFFIGNDDPRPFVIFGIGAQNIIKFEVDLLQKELHYPPSIIIKKPIPHPSSPNTSTFGISVPESLYPEAFKSNVKVQFLRECQLKVPQKKKMGSIGLE
jgi:hypothetical protein